MEVESVNGILKLAEYGVLAVVTGMLAGGIIFLIKSHRSERKEVHKCFAEQIERLMEKHAAERDEWRITTVKQFEKSEQLAKEYIKESSENAEKITTVVYEVKGAINTINSNLNR